MSKENRTIRCTNANGYSIIFGETAISPFLLTNATGLYSTEYTVTTQDNGNSDGSTLMGHKLKERNIVLELTDVDRYASHRDMLDKLFSIDGILEYNDGFHKRMIEYTVEKIGDDGGKHYSRTRQVSLLCPNPYFSDIEDNEVEMSKIVPLFEFPHYFEKAEEISRIEIVQNAEIDNENGAETGIIITIEALGTVVNPSISIEESNEHITVGIDGSKDFTLEANDKLTITTLVDDCHIYLEKDGKKEEINMYLPTSSDFIRLQPGINHIGYTAKTGESNMIVSISFKRNYLGA